MRYLSLLAILCGCSVIDDDNAGANFQRFPESCLHELTPYIPQINSQLPGNSSSMQFLSCEVANIPVHQVNLSARVQLRQRVCKFGSCINLWSYTTTIYGQARFDQNCELFNPAISMNPGVPILIEYEERALREAAGAWQRALAKKPHLRRYCP